MSEEQLAALLAKLQEDADLREKVQGAEDLDAAEALVQQAGFDVSKADWLKYQDEIGLQSSELNDKELEVVAGGNYKNRGTIGPKMSNNGYTCRACRTR